MRGETSRRGERGVVSREWRKKKKKVIWGGFQGRVNFLREGQRGEEHEDCFDVEESFPAMKP